MAASNRANLSADELTGIDLLKTLAAIWRSGKEIPFPNSFDESKTANGKLKDALLELRKFDQLLKDENFSSDAAEIRDMIGTVVFQDLERGLAEWNTQIGNQYQVFEYTIKEIVMKALPPPGSEGRILLSFNLIHKLPKFAEYMPKVVSWKCDGIRAPYPRVYSSQFLFHNDTPYSWRCETEQGHKFNLMKENLVHQTNSIRLQRLLVALLENSESQIMEIKPNLANLLDKKHGDSYPTGLVYFGVKHPDSLEERLDSIPNAQDLQKYSKSVKLMKECRYGPCQIISSAGSVFKTNGVEYAFNRGTKIYRFEYSQQIFVSSDLDTLYTLNVDTSKVHNLEEIENIQDFEWEFKYCGDGNWTNLEVVLLGGAKCKLGEFKVEFSEEHECISGRSCCNCVSGILTSVADHPENAIECASPSKISKLIDKIRVKNWPPEGKSGVIKMFALTFPSEFRAELEKAQEKYKIFSDEDFEEIKGFWFNHPGTYTFTKT